MDGLGKFIYVNDDDDDNDTTFVIGLMSWVFVHGPKDRGSIPGRVIPRT